MPLHSHHFKMASKADVKVPANSPCCICGAPQSALVFTAEYPYYNYPGTFEMRRCAGCGLLFNSPRLPPEGIDRLYGANYYFFRRRPAGEFRRIQETWARTVATVEGMVPRREVLEIGSAKGFLLAVMQGDGWDVEGVELSPFAATYARDRLGVPTFTGRVEQFAEAGGRPRPLVLGIDVIEHVLDPRLFVASLVRVVEPGGVLLIDTPNGNAANIERQGVRWKGFNPFHIFLFSVQNLSALLAEHGFVVEVSFSYGNAPAEPEVVTQGDTPGRRLARSALRRVGVLDALREARERTLEAMDDRRLARLVRGSVAEVHSAHEYRASEDSRLPLAAGERGDNIVVIARRS